MTAHANQVAETIRSRCANDYPTMFRNRVAVSASKVAFTVPQSDSWRDVTWAEVRDVVDRAAAGLLSLGLRYEQRVAIACATRLEWIEADLAIASAGATTTTIYPATNVEDMSHIIIDSGAVMMVVENNEQLTKVHQAPELDDQVHAVIIIDDDRPADAHTDERVIVWTELLDRGAAYLLDHPTCVDDSIDMLKPDSLSTLIYTSGTTGVPKGVEILHESWAYEGAAIEHLNFIGEDDVNYLWLPLSHVFGRDLVAVQLQIGFRSIVDGRVDRIVDGLATTHPTVLVGVPRIFEKVRAAVMTMYPQNGLKGRISRWAFKVGRESRPYRLAERPLPVALRVRYAIAEKLVFSKLKRKLGGRMRFMISGSAKLSRQVQEWFYSAGITVVEGYGATETSAIAFLNLPQNPRFGTVGPVIPGLETKLAADGEVMIKGPTIARGYHNLPAETAEAFNDGWFGTGDIGALDSDGYLTITDRKKDLFKTSNGKFVAPQKIEGTVMANIPYVSQVVAIGQDRKFVTALVTLDEQQLRKWASRRGKSDLSYAELTQDPGIRNSIDRFMRKVNSRLERWEQIKRYTILPSELSLADGTLTPSLKVRRDEVNAVYADEINAMYADDAPRSNLVVS